ncbi:unnamed protein product, partial [Owenia fusiformis]
HFLKTCLLAIKETLLKRFCWKNNSFSMKRSASVLRIIKNRQYAWKRERSSSAGSSTVDYCINLVKKYDYENYLCNLLLPQEARVSSFAIRSFNVETAQVGESVTEKQTALMRMQFWSDAIEKIYKDAPPQTPVALELWRAVQKHKLSKRWLNRILEERKKNLENPSNKTIEEVEKYSENTVSSINYLLLESIGVKDLTADHAASHLGKCQGIVTLLRAVPHHAQRRRTFLPQQTLIQHSVAEEEVFRGCKEKKMLDVIYDIASVANSHLEKARSMKKDVPKSTHKVFLPAGAMEQYLLGLQKVDFNVYHSSLQQRNNWLPWTLWKKKIMGGF